MFVTKNNFNGFKDKGISIGERTTVTLADNILTNNNIGIEVKDSSTAYVVRNTFEGNTLAMNSYRKKPLYNGGTIVEFDNVYENNAEKYTGDKFALRQQLLLSSKETGLLTKLILQENLPLLFDFFTIIEAQI